MDWQHQNRANRDAFDHFREIYWKAETARHTPLTRAETEKILNDGKPLIRGDSEFDRSKVRDPVTGGEAYVRFDGDTCHDIEEVTTNRPTIQRVDDPAFTAVEVARRVAWTLGLVAAAGMLLIVAIDGPHHRRSWQLVHACDLLAISVFAGAAAMLGPQYHHSWSSFFQDDSGGWGIVGVGFALLFMLRALLVRPKHRGGPICRNCRYNLTGNRSGICPECGTTIAADPRHSQRATSAV
jgi:hypothetical protein